MLDELPTEYQIFLWYPPFHVTPHNSHFELLSVLLLMLDGLPTEHHIFLGYLPLQITLHNSHSCFFSPVQEIFTLKICGLADQQEHLMTNDDTFGSQVYRL
jgi:hypothetical protein